MGSSLGLTKERRKMVIVLIAGALLVVLNQTLLSPALPSIMEHLNVNATTVQWLTSAYALTEAVVIPLAAWFMGRFSTRTLFIGGLALFGAGSLVAALAPVFAVLLLGRIMQALSTGVLMVMVMSLILLSFPRESRGQAMGLVGLVIAFAPAVGPSVGGVLVDVVGWRALFIVVVFFTVLIMALAAKVLVNHEGFPRTSADAASVVFSSLGLASLLYGLSSFASSSHVELCVALIVAGVVLVSLFVRRQFKLEEPMLRLEVVKSRRYRSALLTIALLQAALIGLGVLMPLYIQDVLGYSATVSGLTTLPGAVLGALAGLIGGRIFDKSGVRKICLFGTIVMVVGAVGMLLYDVDSSLVLVVAANIVSSLGIQLLISPANTWGVNSLPNDLVQHATSVTNTVNQVGGSLGTALIVSFSALGSAAATQLAGVERVFAGYQLSFYVVILIMLIVLVMVVLFIRDKPGDVVPEARTPRGEGESFRRVADVMDRSPLTVSSDATVGAAINILAEHDASGVIVVDGDGIARGFISNGDILRYFGDEEQNVTGPTGITVCRGFNEENVEEIRDRLAQAQVMDIATKKVVSVAPELSVEEACATLAGKKLKMLPVTEHGKLVGVLHRSDLMRLIAQGVEKG